MHPLMESREQGENSLQFCTMMRKFPGHQGAKSTQHSKVLKMEFNRVLLKEDDHKGLDRMESSKVERMESSKC